MSIFSGSISGDGFLFEGLSGGLEDGIHSHFSNYLLACFALLVKAVVCASRIAAARLRSHCRIHHEAVTHVDESIGIVAIPGQGTIICIAIEVTCHGNHVCCSIVIGSAFDLSKGFWGRSCAEVFLIIGLGKFKPPV